MKGTVEKIVFSNETNGFTVAKFLQENSLSPITIVGNLNAIVAGEVLTLEGEWENSNFGPQFKVASYEFIVPTTKQAIEKYLGSGLIKGIGPSLAARLVKKFGEKTLDIIEHKPELLKQVSGIGKNRIGLIYAAWKEQKEIKNIMLFLQSHEISTTYSLKIYKHYGEHTIAILKKNPYKLVTDITGIGFKIADKIAMKLGIQANDVIRVEAGILFVINELIADGHTYFPKKDLVAEAAQILKTNEQTCTEAITTLINQQTLSLLIINDVETIYLAPFLTAEKNVALKINQLLAEKITHNEQLIASKITTIEQKTTIRLDPVQIEAIKKVFSKKITVITGGPGTGKTTIVKFIAQIFKHLGKTVSLAAPTGRAAKQLTKACGLEAKTIHRLLDFNPGRDTFLKNANDPLQTDALIVDEASMIDLILMHHLLEAVPNYAHLILVGDVDQLPSVNAGNVLSDIIESTKVPCVALTKIFRQDKLSLIVENAHKINKGILPDMDQEPKGQELKDFYFIEKTDPKDTIATLITLITKRIPSKFGFDSIDDIQILSPMHKGDLGVQNLNQVLQETLNHTHDQVIKGAKRFKKNDKVMQLKNNYDKEIYNGDIGKVTTIDEANELIKVTFEDKEVIYDKYDIDELTLAYAVSVHKSQGSEYKCVIILLTTAHYMLLQRNMLYTAITRGKQLVIILGSKEALKIAVNNNKITYRYSNLKNFICACAKSN